MPRPKPDRSALLDSLAAHVLAHGLVTASLRPMAAAVGTSDRMLIYHFGSKEALIAAVLDHLALQMAEGLDQALPPRRFASEAELLAAILPLLRAPGLRPYLRLWFDVIAASALPAGAAQAVPRGSGRRILTIYLDWIARRHPQGTDGAPACLALVEGLLVLEAAGAPDLADLALSGLAGGKG